MMDALAPVGLLLLAGISAVEALRCIADRLLATALVYSLAALGLMAAGAKVAVDAL